MRAVLREECVGTKADTLLAPEDACGIPVYLGNKRLEVPRGRNIPVRTPPSVPVVAVERPETGASVEPELGDRGFPPYRRITETRPDLKQRDGITAYRVCEANLVSNVRKHAAVVEAGKRPFNEALFELG